MLLQSKLLNSVLPKDLWEKLCSLYGRSDQLEVDCELMMNPFGIDVKTVLVFAILGFHRSSSLELNICGQFVLYN